MMLRPCAALPAMSAPSTPQDPMPPTMPDPRRRALLGQAAGLALAAPLAGCASSAPSSRSAAINSQHRAQGQDSRALFLVLHFTSEPFEASLRILTRQAVSAHYLLSDEAPPVVYQLVPEQQRAWHAGDSAWGGHSQLNASSIGVEIVNPGALTLASGERVFAPYPAAQIDRLIPLLQDIVQRHQIRPDRVLGHSDIAPQRKLDPGPAFPWQRLAVAGLLRWPDPAQVAALLPGYAAAPPSVAWLQQVLAHIGYSVPASGLLDPATQRVVAAFQMKYRPARFDGQPDAQTAALLHSLAGPVVP